MTDESLNQLIEREFITKNNISDTLDKMTHALKAGLDFKTETK